MKILQLFSGVLGKNPRPTRFFKDLSVLGEVFVASKSDPKAALIKADNFIKIHDAPWSQEIQASEYENEIWSNERKADLQALSKHKFSLIVCQEIDLLPLAVTICNLPQNKANCRLIMDAREFYPLQFENIPEWKENTGALAHYICQKYLSQVDVVFTVSAGLLSRYKSDYNIDCILLPSFSDYYALSPNKTDTPLRFIHHGNSVPGRKLELMIEAFRHLEGIATLDFMMVPLNPVYHEVLCDHSQTIPNVNFIAPVSLPEIVPFISKYDMGIHFLPKNTFNHNHTMANKFFEFIQARLGIVVSPVEDMSNFVQEKNVGITTPDFSVESLVATVMMLNANIVNLFKNSSHALAKEVSWESNTKLIHKIVQKLLA